MIGDDYDDDDYSDEERERLEDDAVGAASASATAAELEAEIATLRALERQASEVRTSGEDRKWNELSQLLQDDAAMFGTLGRREKLIVFTEHRDTLDYLAARVRQLLGGHDSVLTIHGAMSRAERHRAEERFRQDSDVRVLVATDAAGEGINLQCAHLMVNYDLPWNPNRIEQRFGRVHRIGQTEACHLWNLVAGETREGQVFDRLLKKLEEERVALDGRVFDILGSVTFGDRSLRELLVEAVRHGDGPEVRDRMLRTVDRSLDHDVLVRLLEERALTSDVMSAHTVSRIREDMERGEAHKLEPHPIEAFFVEATRWLGGRVVEREKGRYEVVEVPFAVRAREARAREAVPVRHSYERVCFERGRVKTAGGVTADLVCPGHPLLDATVAAVLERGLGALRQGSVLVDDDETATVPRLLAYVEIEVQDATRTPDGTRRIVSQDVRFVEIDHDGKASDVGHAPYLDYRAPTRAERDAAEALFAEELGWLSCDPDRLASGFATDHIVPAHVAEVRGRTLARLDKVRRAVRTRLREEIAYWDARAWELEELELAGKAGTRQSSRQAARRADELEERLRRRTEQLERQGQLTSLPPRVVGAALVVPAAMLGEGVAGADPDELSADAEARRRCEERAMDAVKRIERELGFYPHDVSGRRKIGYDIESRVPDGLREGDGGGPTLRMIEVKGRIAGGDSVTLTKNEINAALGKPECWLLAIVEVDGATTHTRYLRRPDFRVPSFPESSVNYNVGRLIESSELVLERCDTW